MSAIRELVFDWLINASVQIGLFAILAAILSPLITKAKAKYQHCFYLAIFALCLAAPVFNTLWQARPSVVPEQQSIQGAEHTDHHLWAWNMHSKEHESIILAPGAKIALLIIWQMLFLYRLIHFSRGIYRVHCLRRSALLISLSESGMTGSMIEPPHRVVLLESTAIDDPVTVGVFHPAIILPSKVVPVLEESDLTAILAHEYGHIRRNDFLVHLFCQLTALPVAWHPGIQYLMSKISQTRELACDDCAAVCLGKRILYARTLLRLASLCLRVPRSNAMGLGIFDGDNLEDRIMKLTEKRTLLSRAGLIGLALTTSFLFASSTVLARAVSLQEVSASNDPAQTFAGTWHWMFHGRSFSTMILTQNGSGITGTVTPSRIALGDDGELSKADPSEDSTPSQISKTKLEGNALRVTVRDEKQPFEFIVTLKDATHAEIHPIGAPPNMKPIQAEKVN
ncbi:M56 family metallopeptidase [Tunturiibacter empetritectus]|uniref:Beta-lactamase regulating signal transducer with metallopeptidase domain n=1 Tax=Tunturiibacter lichenicola TaxID=2051959 RepID=A0A852VSC8_9BACT|nr:M56 family metallopeptidase [Edaphobacter lichenicola]NYF92222.1 beta-lactamase regulating signal transducer with metallopeptidase domain [Edaphobacter lichenicola]